MLEPILSANIFAFFVIFMRLGALFMIAPALGDLVVPARVRLGLALAVSLALFPLLSGTVPAMPGTAPGLAAILAGELVIGAFLGGVARLAMTALHVAGTVIAFQTSLAFAQTIDPTAREQGTVIVGMLNVIGVVLIFVAGLHHLMLRALVQSYALFPVATLPSFADVAELTLRNIAGAFAVGVQISAPFIVYGMCFYISLGLLGRLMPRVQLFFVALPAQILLAFALFMVLLPALLLWFLDYFEASFAPFVSAG